MLTFLLCWYALGWAGLALWCKYEYNSLSLCQAFWGIAGGAFTVVGFCIWFIIENTCGGEND